MDRHRHMHPRGMAIPARQHIWALTAATVATGCLLGGAFADEAVPDSENGRYTMSAMAGGVIRLDSRTGAIAICNNTAGNNGVAWACYAVPDERAAMDAEIGRLQADNANLRTQLAARDRTGKIDETLPKDQVLPKSDQLQTSKPSDGSRKIEIPKIEIPLPSDEDVNRVMGFVEQAWRRLRDMANRVQKDVSGRI